MMAEIEVTLANLAAVQWRRRGHKVAPDTVRLDTYVAHRRTVFASVRTKTRRATMAVKLWPNELGCVKRINPGMRYKYCGAEMVRYWLQCEHVEYRHATLCGGTTDVLTYEVTCQDTDISMASISIEFDEVI